MNKLRAEVYSCSIKLDAVLIDGGSMLHKRHLPTDDLVKDLVDGAGKYIWKIILKSDVFLIFDHYMPDSKGWCLSKIRSTLTE